MKRLLYLIPVLILLASMIPLVDVAAYDEGDVQVFYDMGGGVWVEIDQGEDVEFTDYFQLKIILNTGDAVEIWTMASFQFYGGLDYGETFDMGYGISGAGSSTYSGTVVSGMDAIESFTQAADPGGSGFYSASGPTTVNVNSSQFITWELTSGGGLPSTSYYHMEERLSGGASITGPIMFRWGVLNFDPDCDNTYTIEETIVSSQEIDATDEDGEYAEVLEGNLYRLEVWGGPWDDGADPNRYDTALSFDGVEWIPLTEYFVDGICYDVGEEPGTGTLYFLAPADEFYIRVNDEDDAFGDNDGAMGYSLALAVSLTELTCSDQFTWEGEGGDPIAAYTIPGNSSAGIEITDLEIGEWYVYVTRDGPWYNSGITERYDMAVQDTTGDWEPIADYEMVECIEDAEDIQYTRYYFQAWGESLWTRVNDTDTSWNNTGSMGVDIYAAEFDRHLTACEMTYILGDLVISKNFQGNQSGGVNVGTYDHFNNLPRGGGEGPFEVLRYYILDTLDGPWYDSGDPLFTAQMRKDATGDWYETVLHPELDCVAETDKLGHVRAYFDMDKPYEWYIRVNETTSWIDNSGSMRYNLYEAMNGQVIDPDDTPEAGYCDDYYTRGAQVGAITFSATNSTGVNVPGITEYNEIYSIVTSGGPWDDGTDPNRLDIAISPDGGLNWFALSEYPGMLCKQIDNTDYIEVFLQHVRGARWKVRVDDTVFTDNSGTMSITVYGSETTDQLDPWDTCSDHYRLEEIPIPDREIWSALLGGKNVPYIEPSSKYIYAIEITDGPWLDDDTERYVADIWDGTAWYSHNSYGICSEQVGSENQYFRTYFDPEGSNYKLRADDMDDDWLNNSGSFGYRLYRAYPDEGADPDDPADPGGPPPDWDLSCYAPCTRPSGLFSWVTITIPLVSWEFDIPFVNVGSWLEYGRCSFTKFVSWCPEHTAALKAIPLTIRNREPFSSMYVLADAGEDIQAMLDSYDWYPESAPSALLTLAGGGEGEQTTWSFIPEMEQSPWNNGEITFGDGGTIPGGGEGNDLDCPADMKESAAAAFGVEEDSPFMTGYCFTVRTPFILKAYWMWITLSVEISFIFFFIKYIINKVRSML